MADYGHSRGSINQVASPIRCVDETLGERQDVVEDRKKKSAAAQHQRSPFLIGSIDEVNRRISKLDEKLQHYTQLVVESRVSDTSSSMTDIVAYSDMVRDTHKKKERETQEVNQFAGVYSFKSTFFNKPNERMRNIQKITMSPSKPGVSTRLKKDAVAGKPKFVELHQYPGYHPKELTALPHDCQTVDVLMKVAAAQPKADLMSATYKAVFEKFFRSEMSKSILQDIFWWIFLEKWQPNKQVQQLLFNRVAHNYVKLLIYAKHPQYRYTFLRDFPNLLAQSVYTAFCETFPDSYRQFNEEFKEDIISLVFEWVTGIAPAPRLWLQWNLDKLEPAGIKLREDMLKQNKGHKKSTPASSVLSFLDLIESSMGGHQQMGSQSTIYQAGSISSLSSVQGSKRVRHAKKRNNQETGSDTSQQRSQKSDPKAVDNSKHKSKLDIGYKSRVKLTEDGLTPIHEFDEESRLTKGSMSGSPDAKVSIKSSMLRKPSQLESHPIGKGAEVTKVTLDVNGRSPLVAHYLRMRNLEYDTGFLCQIQFSTITSLPALDATTYKDVLRQSYKNMHQLDKKIKKVYERETIEQSRFLRRQRHVQEQLKAKQAMLLSKPAEVKQIADLIILGQKTDKDSFTGCAEAAIQAALMNQEVTPG